MICGVRSCSKYFLLANPTSHKMTSDVENHSTSTVVFIDSAESYYSELRVQELRVHVPPWQLNYVYALEIYSLNVNRNFVSRTALTAITTILRVDAFGRDARSDSKCTSCALLGV
jgi:hypothetical protein